MTDDTELEQPIAISPHHNQVDFERGLTLDDEFALFADRVRGWQLDVAERLARTDPHAGFAVLAIVFSYFEMIAKYEYGWTERDPQKHFVAGARGVLEPLLVGQRIGEGTLTELYKAGRSFLYHEGFLAPSLGITGRAEVETLANGVQVELPLWIDASWPVIWINPKVLVDWMQRHFSRYLARLQNPSETELRENFDRRIGRATPGQT